MTDRGAQVAAVDVAAYDADSFTHVQEQPTNFGTDTATAVYYGPW